MSSGLRRPRSTTTRWEYLHSPMHSAGYALDPEFMEMTEKDEATQTGLITIVERIALRDELATAEELPSSNTHRIELVKKMMDHPNVQDRIAKTMAELVTYQQREGIFTKPFVIAGAKTMAPAVWWDTYCKHLPHLSSVARRVLAQPICASAAERNWSVYGAIKTSARGRLNHAVSDKLVYCHEALHFQGKLQTAAYKQAAEKWDSDSDSDDTDDENLKV